MVCGIGLQAIFQQHARATVDMFFLRWATFAFISIFFPRSKCCNYNEIIETDVEICIYVCLNEWLSFPFVLCMQFRLYLMEVKRKAMTR